MGAGCSNITTLLYHQVENGGWMLQHYYSSLPLGRATLLPFFATRQRIVAGCSNITTLLYHQVENGGWMPQHYYTLLCHWVENGGWMPQHYYTLLCHWVENGGWMLQHYYLLCYQVKADLQWCKKGKHQRVWIKKKLRFNFLMIILLILMISVS